MFDIPIWFIRFCPICKDIVYVKQENDNCPNCGYDGSWRSIFRGHEAVEE